MTETSRFAGVSTLPETAQIVRGGSTTSRVAGALILAGIAVWLAVAHPQGSALGYGVLFVACLSVSYMVGRGAPAMRIYVLFMIVWFLLGPVLGRAFPSLSPGLSSSEFAAVWLTASVWLLGWSAGQLLIRRRAPTAAYVPQAPPAPRRISHRDASVGLIIVGIVGLLTEIEQVLHGATSYVTQVEGAVNSGVTGTIAALAAPALTTGLVLAWPTATRGRRCLLLLLIIAQAWVSSLDGFSGTAAEFLIGTGVAYLVVHPFRFRDKVPAIATALALILVVGIPLTLLGSSVRQKDDASLGYDASALSLRNVIPAAIERLDETAPLATGLQAVGPAAKQAVSMEHQLEDLVPRVLWPDKPIFNYGEQLSQAIYGLPATELTASTITWLGDLDVNGGLLAVLVAGLLMAAITRSTFERAVEGPALTALAAVLLLEVLLDPEAPLVLNLAGAIKSLILLGIACYAGAIVRQLLRRTATTPRTSHSTNLAVDPGD